MKNNIVVVLMVILIGVITGVGILVSISNAVQVANMPLFEKASQLVDNEKVIVQKIVELNRKITIVDGKLSQLNDRFGGGQRVLQAPSAQQPAPPSEDYNKVYDIPVGNSPIVGNLRAKVTITEFSDLQCPFCARFYPPVKEALKAYPNDLRLIIKNYPLPFHPNALPAAKMSLAANEQGKYIEMVEILLDNAGDVSEAKVKGYAQKIGLNYDKLMADVKANDAKYQQQISDDMALAGRVDVQGTPTFFINGKKTMARDFNGYKTEIDKILAGK